MIEFLVGLLVIILIAILSLVVTLLFPLLLLMGIFLRFRDLAGRQDHAPFDRIFKEAQGPPKPVGSFIHGT